jgi:aspartate aminotransferase/aminotransferase
MWRATALGRRACNRSSPFVLKEQIGFGLQSFSSDCQPRKQLSKTASDVPRSGIRAVMDLAWKLEAEGVRVMHLEVGQPDFAAPAHAIEAAKTALDQGHTKYIPNAGITSFRQSVANMYNRRESTVNTSYENVMVTTGSMFAFSTALMAVLDPGDEVLIPDPGFPNYGACRNVDPPHACCSVTHRFTEMSIRLMHAVPVRYSLSLEKNFIPDVSELEHLITDRTKLLMVNSPGNPTGAVFPLEKMQELADFARKHGLFLLSDEIYSDMVFGDDQEEWSPSILQTQHDEAQTITVSGVAKNYAMTGFRVGWLRASEEVVAVASKLQEPFVSCGVHFNQLAAQAVMDGDQECVQYMREQYRGRRDAALRVFEENGLDGNVNQPGGAFYMMVDCEADSETFCRNLLRDKHVAVAPGSAFGDVGSSCVRVAFAQEKAVIEEGVQLLCDYIKAARK